MECYVAIKENEEGLHELIWKLLKRGKWRISIVVLAKNLPANAGDSGSSPGPGRSLRLGDN